jgi:hypothetical protein
MDFRAVIVGPGLLRITANDLPAYEMGERVIVSIERGRSMASHRHQFAWLNDAWLSLPEEHRNQPWAETAETMRRHALIATGFHQTYTLDCGSNATAQRIKGALVAAEVRGHGYAIGQVRGPVVTVWTPESQSLRAMGGERFKASKDAVMDWIADKLGVAPDELQRAAG